MTDQQIIDALIARDERITKQFFFGNCRPLFVSIIRNVFSCDVDYDEFVNEFYLHLMENDAYRLRQFQGRSTIYQWLKVVAIRYFMARRDRVIDISSDTSLIENAVKTETVDTERYVMSKMDVEHLLSLLPNRRYAYVVRRLILNDMEPKVVAKELKVNVDNLYNIKKRAVAALTQAALNDTGKL